MAETVDRFPDDDELPAEVVQVFGWRAEQLEAAGFSEVQATLLALNREVDLHQACELGRRAGPDRAYRILS